MAQSQLEKLQVLAVDDENLMQRLVYGVLKQLGFGSVTVLNSGRSAIECISRRPFDFIVTDWRMEDLDGIDLIHFIRMSPQSTCPRVPIILLTANTEARYVFKARDVGVNEYIIKPFTAEQLVRRIRSIIERPRRFIDSPTYRGPERRYHDAPAPKGVERRKTDAQQVAYID